MKKIFYFIASAIVALGAVACQNDIDETIDNNQQTEGYSIKVTIDEQTRVALGEADADKKRKLTFTENDVLVVRSGWQEGTNYLFEYAKTEGDVYTFTCEAEGVNSLVGTNPYIFYLGGLHKSADDLTQYGTICNTSAENISGIGMYYDAANPTDEYKFGDEEYKVTLQALPLLKFTAYEPVTFKSTNPSQFFYDNGSGDYVWQDSYTTKQTGEIYLPIMPSSGGESTITVTTESGFENNFTKKLKENVIYNLGTIEPTYKVHVIAQPGTSYADWTKVNLYTWITDGAGLEWPGQDITDKTTEINGYTYNVFEYPTEYNNNIVNVIVNNGTKQTEDIELGTLDKDYYVIYSPVAETQVLTEAPAAGSIEEYVAPTVVDPKPDTVTLYLKTDWGWTNWALYAWGGTGTWGNFNSWPGKAMEYTQQIGESTYKAWDIPASCVGQTNTQVIITGKEWGETKQTKDTPVTFTAGKDVFVEITGWDSSVSKANLSIITSPY